VWYDYDLLEKVPGGEHTMDTPLHRVPVYLRGGTIVPRKDRIRRSSSLTTLDPYTLIVAVDEKVPIINSRTKHWEPCTWTMDILTSTKTRNSFVYNYHSIKVY
jgi:alpha-glucosidase (family GH31 glycosyl hydrolase)